MRVLVAGAATPLGRVLVERFSQADQVVALSLDGRPVAATGFGLSMASGSLADPAAAAVAIAGCEAVIYCAASLDRPAVVPGALALAAAARREGVRRAVVVASSAVWWPERDPGPWHRRVQEAAAELLGAVSRGCALGVGLVVAPGVPGGDRVLRRLVATPEAALPAGALHLSDARDLGGAAEGALFRGQPGVSYALAGHRVEARALAGRLRAAGLEGGGPDLAECSAAGLWPVAVDGARATEELGWWARPLERTLAEVVGAGE